MGYDKAKHIWVEEKVETWVVWVNPLVGFLTAFPHTEYAVLTMYLQQECQFVHNFTPSVGPLFVPLEEASMKKILLDLLGVSIDEVADFLCKHIDWGVKRMEIGIPYHTHQL